MSYSSSNPPISDINILSIQGSWRRLWHNATFLLVLNGEVQVQVDEHATYLYKNGVMLVEPDTPFYLTGHGSNLLLVIRMDCDFYSQGRTGRFGSLVCNSVEDSQRDYSMLRQMLSHLALDYFENAECKELRQLELSYALLYYLNTTHFVAGSPSAAETVTNEKRGLQLISYIESNYMNEIRLEDLSQTTYLSTSYLSRLFKKMTGMNFKSYLEEVRLSHAAEDLRNTDLTITAIAYNNGFPNVSALSSAIRKKYGMAPNEFRKSLLEEQPAEQEQLPYQEVDYDDVRKNLEILAGSEPPKAVGMYSYPGRLEYRVEDVSKFRPIKPIWKTMINVGTLSGLTNVTAKSQLTMLQEEIGFQYARIERVLSEEYIPTLQSGRYNFAYFDRAIELLLSLKLKPFLDCSFKGDYTVVPRSEEIYRGDRPRSGGTEQEFLDKASALLRHCINTFGANEVETWGIEICALHNEDLIPVETPEEFTKRFVQIYRMIKQWLPKMLVGGPEQNIAMDGEFLRRTVVLLRQAGICPDFISVCAVPYEPTVSEDDAIRYVISPNPDYFRDYIQSIREMVGEVFGQNVPIWVTVFGPDVRIRNYVNDSCFQAAFITKNTLDLIDLADVIGYWQLSDLDAEYIDTTRILFGGTGIISKDGLKKPGFTALKRLVAVNPLLIEKTGNMLVTTNAVNTYNIVLYNYAHFDNVYCLSNGEGVTCDNVYTVFSNTATKDIRIHLGGLPQGRYKVITTTLNREYGSLFDEWQRYGVLDGLQPHDIHYLQDIVHPNRAVRYYDCEAGNMELTMQMLPHEVKFLIIIREL